MSSKHTGKDNACAVCGHTWNGTPAGCCPAHIAARDLLAALKALRDLRDQWRKDDRFTSIDYMDAIDAMPWESAISRAEGGGE